jgi:hypothetical protein
MDVTSLPLSPSTSLFAWASMLPAVAAFVVLVLVGRGRRGKLWLVPGWVASAALAPLLAAFFGMPQLIATFRGMASGGGSAAIAAGIYEAVQPIVGAAWVAALIALVALILTMRGIGELEENDEAAPPPSRA